jgi:hypothetical protein
LVTPLTNIRKIIGIPMMEQRTNNPLVVKMFLMLGNRLSRFLLPLTMLRKGSCNP